MPLRFARLPDFDQLWKDQLPGDGQVYCLPASALNVLTLLVESEPELFVYPPLLEPVDSGYPAPSLEDGDIVQMLATLGSQHYCKTGEVGTTVPHAVGGLRRWMADQLAPDASLPYQVNGYNLVHGDLLSAQRILDWLDIGARPIIQIGWWDFDGQLKAFVRHNGHFLSLADLRHDQKWKLTVTDPLDLTVDNGDNDEFDQSAFLTAPSDVVEQQRTLQVATKGEPTTVTVKLPDVSAFALGHQAALIDGVVLILPIRAGVPADDGVSVDDATDEAGSGEPKPVAHWSTISDIAFDPLTPAVFYTTTSPPAIWRLDPLPGRPAPLEPWAPLNSPPSRLCFVGNSGDLLVSTGDGVMRIDRELPTRLNRVPLPPGAGNATYDPATGSLAFVGEHGEAVHVGLDDLAPIRNLPPQLQGYYPKPVAPGEAVSVVFAPRGQGESAAVLLLHRDGTSVVYSTARSPVTLQIDPAVRLSAMAAADDGSLFFLATTSSGNGTTSRIAQFNPDGSPVKEPLFAKSTFKNARGFALSRSFTNVRHEQLDPTVWRNVPPPRATPSSAARKVRPPREYK